MNYKPSVDITFASAANEFGGAVLGWCSPAWELMAARELGYLKTGRPPFGAR